MKNLLLFLIVVIGVVDVLGNDEHHWKKFKAMFNKVYESKKEENDRKSIFLKNKRMVDLHNMKFENGEVGFKMSINQFSDLTEDEKDALVLCVNFSPGKFSAVSHNRTRPRRKFPKRNPSLVKDVPDDIDWREKGKVGPVRDEGACSACYAIAASEAMQSRRAIKDGAMIELAAQQIVDCSMDFGNKGCDGGDIESSYIYLLAREGLTKEEFYPYNGFVGECQDDKKKIFTGLLEFEKLEEYEIDIMRAVSEGPVAATINTNVNSFLYYAGGIYDDSLCTDDKMTYAVTIVGYGTDPIARMDYWIIKNSWGENWGENGFMRLFRGKNLCGILRNVYAPKIKIIN